MRRAFKFITKRWQIVCWNVFMIRCLAALVVALAARLFIPVPHFQDDAKPLRMSRIRLPNWQCYRLDSAHSTILRDRCFPSRPVTGSKSQRKITRNCGSVFTRFRRIRRAGLIINMRFGRSFIAQELLPAWSCTDSILRTTQRRRSRNGSFSKSFSYTTGPLSFKTTVAFVRQWS